MLLFISHLVLQPEGRPKWQLIQEVIYSDEVLIHSLKNFLKKKQPTLFSLKHFVVTKQELGHHFRSCPVSPGSQHIWDGTSLAVVW